MTFVESGATIAVTGATGFVGQTLVEHLAAFEYQVIGISDSREPPARVRGALREYHCADLTRGWPSIGRIDGIIHLAGLAAVEPSFDEPNKYLCSGGTMMTNICEHYLREGWKGRIVVVSTGSVYGASSAGEAFSETAPCVSTSPYVVSKLLVENLADYYRRRGIDTVTVRPFNHIGPGQGRGFIVPDLVANVMNWKHGTQMHAGNLGSRRDYTDVRDVVNAYRMLLETPNLQHSLYNVCSGVDRSGWQILEAVCRALDRPIPPVVVAERRALDPSTVRGDAKRLMNETGWQPTVELQQSIDEFTVVSSCS